MRWSHYTKIPCALHAAQRNNNKAIIKRSSGELFRGAKYLAVFDAGAIVQALPLGRRSTPVCRVAAPFRSTFSCPAGGCRGIALLLGCCCTLCMNNQTHQCMN